MSLLNRRWLIVLFALGFIAPALAEEPKKDEKPNDAAIAAPHEGTLKRHESFNERVKKGNVDLLFIGDSITQGWEGSGAKVWKEFYEKRNAVNLGIGGDRT